MEHILHKAILIYLEKYNILTECQHGFRQGRSFEEDIALNMDSGIQTDMLIWCCPRQRLLAKLQYYGIRGNVFFWISTWLIQRNQRVVVNGKLSEPSKVLSGVPRGTVLAPLFFFMMFVNDIGDNLSSKTKLRLFSDDTKCTVLYRPRDSEKEARIL